MNKAFIFILFAILLAGFSIQHSVGVQSINDSTTVLQPEPLHFDESIVITSILSRYHYRQIQLNDSLSSAIFDRYLSSMDYSKLYFLKSDIEYFEPVRYKIDDYLRDGKVDGMYEIFTVYTERLDYRLEKIQEQLTQPFDFTKDEYYQADRENAPWANSLEDLDDQWRKVLKSQILSLKLTGKTNEEASEVLVKRYDRYREVMTDYTSEDVFQLFMNAVSESFDPHTNYFSPATADNFNIEMSRSLEGIGAQLRSINDYTTIVGIVAGGPAFKSNKVFENDKIVGVGQGDDGEMEDVIGWRIDEVVKKIRGPKGSKVRLSIISDSDGVNALPHEIELIREKINLEDQRAEKKIMPVYKDGIEYKFGVIEIPSFYMDYQSYMEGNEDYNSTTGDVKKIIKELKEEDVDGILIDLRRNGGGSLGEAVQLTGLFIEEGPVVQVKSMDGKIDIENDPDPDMVYDGPLAVLTSHWSASASEIFAGAIQDYGRGLVIGDQTYGKGSVQQMIQLNQFMKPEFKENSGQLKLTMAKYYRITGNSTQNTGVTPDILLPSAYESEDIGESSQPSALPWDRIKSTDFENTGYVSKETIDRLNDSYQESLLKDQKLLDLLADIAQIKSLRNNDKISLNEGKRMKERNQEQSELSGEVSTSEVAEETPEQIEDPYVYSGINILAELVRMKSK